MPYVLVSTQNIMEAGPTVCGDADADPELMEKIGAKLTQQMGNVHSEYVSESAPRIVLNKLEEAGYIVVAQSGPGQTLAWTLRKPLA
eukprot:m.435887 g.435887  ORF g.435887 m.435887 type:complete len:87 (-) comp17907_c0_seq1:3218-3478(-)